MLIWLSAYWGSLIVIALLALAVGLIIRSLIRQKKKGASCSCGCAGCAYGASCPGAKQKSE